MPSFLSGASSFLCLAQVLCDICQVKNQEEMAVIDLCLMDDIDFAKVVTPYLDDKVALTPAALWQLRWALSSLV